MSALQNFLVLSLSFLALISCRSGGPVAEDVNQPNAPKQAERKGQAAQKDVWGWDYQGVKGPKNWAKLNRQYQTCETGQNQSPINLVWHKPTPTESLKIMYAEGNATLVNTGYTYRLELTPQSSIILDNTEYLLEKIEFRTPSEHQLSGNNMPVEMQFYHRSSNGLKQAVLSLFAIQGRSSGWFDKIWQTAQGVSKYKSSKSFRFNPAQLVPPRKTYYQYEGSITHPPCLEGVRWLVFNTPLQLGSEQIKALKSAYNNNNRPVQPLNDRKVINR